MVFSDRAKGSAFIPTVNGGVFPLRPSQSCEIRDYLLQKIADLTTTTFMMGAIDDALLAPLGLRSFLSVLKLLIIDS